MKYANRCVVNALTLLLLFSITMSTHGSTTRADNFVLLDHQGRAHELYYHRQAPAVVVMMHDHQCQDAAVNGRHLSSLQAQFAGRGVVFFMLNSTLHAQREDLVAAVAAHNISVPVLDDATQLIGEALQVKHSGETLVIDPRNWQIAYQGNTEGIAAALRDLLPQVSEEQTQTSNSMDTSDISDNSDTSHTSETQEAATEACNIDFPQKARTAEHSRISYSRTIAPLLQDKCVVCHSEGGLGPWAMTDYNMVRGFAPMIREVVRTRRMPPWHADPHIGVWKKDLSLSVQQAQDLVHWVEAGAPRGAGDDPLALAQADNPEWPLGTPDLIIDIPPHTIPASGVVDYQFPTVANPLAHGVWVKAATVVPGDREVVHHILAGTQDDDTTELRRTSGVFDNYLIGYAPGNESHQFPAGTGVYIPPGGEFLFQLHYTPVGRETVDRSRMGLYFHTQVPDNFFRQGVVVDPTIQIPAGAARHAEVAYYEFAQDALLHDLVPHAHYRGVASSFELRRPDGSSEVLLSVPDYDFNWQRTYEFLTPQEVPAGSRLVHTTWYDNSAANPGNPDPARQVPWGLQSWDEMLYGAFSYTLVGESTEAVLHDKMRARTAQYVGFLDKNIDGKLSWRELPREIKKRLVQGFKAVDKNGDGGLDIDEMHVITQRLQERQQNPAQEPQGTQNVAEEAENNVDAR